MARRWTVALALALLGVLPALLSAQEAQGKKADADWQSLFDGKTLGGWKVSDFVEHGEVQVQNGTIVLNRGKGDLTGVTWTQPPRRMDYEVSVEAMRVEGHDFFCGLTFPVKDSCCTLIVGGWGGSLVGISSFDGQDASENETTRQMDFDNGRWYQIRVQVTEDRIQAWINDKQLVDAKPGERKISVRFEVDASQPLGIAAWNTKAALRNICVRSLK